MSDRTLLLRVLKTAEEALQRVLAVTSGGPPPPLPPNIETNLLVSPGLGPTAFPGFLVLPAPPIFALTASSPAFEVNASASVTVTGVPPGTAEVTFQVMRSLGAMPPVPAGPNIVVTIDGNNRANVAISFIDRLTAGGAYNYFLNAKQSSGSITMTGGPPGNSQGYIGVEQVG